MAVRIAVVDGQGAGIGKTIVSKLKKLLPGDTEIIALGTNASATVAMLKAGANEGATGENAIVQTAKDVDLIIGCLGIVLAHSMLGELTPRMAEAIAGSRARKLLIPVNRCGVEIIGVRQAPLPEMVDLLVQEAVTAVRGQA